MDVLQNETISQEESLQLIKVNSKTYQVAHIQTGLTKNYIRTSESAAKAALEALKNGETIPQRIKAASQENKPKGSKAKKASKTKTAE